MRSRLPVLLALALLAAAVAGAAEGPPAAPAETLRELLAKLADPSPDVRERGKRRFLAAVHHAARPDAEAERAAMAHALCQQLASPPSQDATLVLLEALEHAGRAEAVPVLARLLGRADPRVRERARRALAANPSPEAVEALRLALAEAQTAPWRIALVNALGHRRDEAAVPALLPLARSPDEAVRTVAVEALARIGAPAAVSVVTEATQKATTRESWTRAMVAYLALADALAEGGQKTAALAMYRPLLEAPGHLRCAALLGLGKAGGAEELPVLLDALAGEDAQARHAAKSALDRLPVEAVTQALGGQAQGAPPETKAALLDVLAQRGDASVLPAFLAAAKDPAPSVRLAAYEGMGAIGSDQAVPVLLGVLAKVTGEESEAVAAALSRLHGPAATRALIQALGQGTATFRLRVMDLLADRRATEAVPALLKAAREEDAAVRHGALGALGQLVDAAALPRLAGLLVQAEDEADRSAAEKALAAACRRLEEPEACAPPLVDALDAAPVPARCALLRVLGRVESAQALAALRAARKSENAAVRDAAVRALAAWPGPAALNDLLDIARTTEDETHRVLALRGAVRLAGQARDRTAEEVLGLYEAALAAARRPEEKRRVLAGLAERPSRGALQIAARHLDEAALKDEAAAAVVRLAQSLFGAYRQEVRAALQKAIQATENADLAKEARDLLARIGKLGDHVTAWEAAGPYVVEGKGGAQLFDVALPPEQPDAQVDWRLAPPGGYPKHPEWPWAINLAAILGGEERAGYLRTRLWSPAERPAVLELGTDDGVKVWLNGALVHKAPEPRSLKPGEDSVRVTLQKGWNTLLLKVVQGSKDWGAALRVRAPDGGPIEGLRADPRGR